MSHKRHFDNNEKFDMGRRYVSANQASVIMIREIYSRGRFQLYMLYVVVLSSLEKLTSIELNPIDVVMKRNTGFITTFDPYLFKCIRNTFLNSFFLYMEKTIQFSHI